MTPHERERFAGLPPCAECEHPAGHHTTAEGCWHCGCDKPPTQLDDAGAIYETDAPGIYATDVDYLITPSALLAMGVRREAVDEVEQRCHDAAGVPGGVVLLTEVV